MLLPMSLFANLPLLVSFLYYNEWKERYGDAATEWYMCIVTDFYSSNDRQHAIDSCGGDLEHWRGTDGVGPYTNPQYGAWGVSLKPEWCAIVTSTCILVISFNSHVSALW